jgi:hypothetical protein
MDKSRKFGALLLTTVFLLTFTVCTKAQLINETDGMYLDNPRLFYAGVVAGANFAQVDGDNFAGYYKPGLNIGGIGYVHIKNHLALNWEILYSEKGAKNNISRLSNLDTAVLITSYKANLNYAEIPVMLNYFDKRKSHVGMGFSYSRLIGDGKETIRTDPPNTVDLTKYPYRKDNIDFLVGAQLRMWKGLFLNIRFQYSLIPARTVSPEAYARSQKQYNNVWAVRLMYLFM